MKSILFLVLMTFFSGHARCQDAPEPLAPLEPGTSADSKTSDGNSGKSTEASAVVPVQVNLRVKFHHSGNCTHREGDPCSGCQDDGTLSLVSTGAVRPWASVPGLFEVVSMKAHVRYDRHWTCPIDGERDVETGETDVNIISVQSGGVPPKNMNVKDGVLTLLQLPVGPNDLELMGAAAPLGGDPVANMQVTNWQLELMVPYDTVRRNSGLSQDRWAHVRVFSDITRGGSSLGQRGLDYQLMSNESNVDLLVWDMQKARGQLNRIGEVAEGQAASKWSADVDWQIGRTSTVEMDLIPQNGYKDWLPKGGKDEKTSGPTFTVKIDIHKPGQPGVAPGVMIKKLTVWLVGTSKERGVCMNFPPRDKGEGDDYDFRIKQPDAGMAVTEEGQHAEAIHPAAKSQIELNCYDYGGWTHLKATAELSDGRQVVGHVKGATQSTELDIPKDDNHNHIADCWEEGRIGSGEATADTDCLPRGNDVEGDGLSLYEEYRGFMCKGVHTRTEPLHKDLFIYDRDNLGIGIFGVSGITVHLIDKGEFKEEDAPDPDCPNVNVINCNRGYATLGAQHLLILINKSSGEFFGASAGNHPGPPKHAKFVFVDNDKCKRKAGPYRGAIIAHELGHASNVFHHGQGDYEACDMQYHSDSTNKWVAWPEAPIPMIAAPKAQTSGVQDCVMRYNHLSVGYYESAYGVNYRWHKDPTEPWVYGSKYDTDPPATSFCAQQEGTGINGKDHQPAPVTGDASKGDCLHQLQVNDLK